MAFGHSDLTLNQSKEPISTEPKTPAHCTASEFVSLKEGKEGG
jgi:hypothetical protein